MAADFKCGTSYFYVSNVRFRVLIECAIEVGQRLAKSPEEEQFVRKLQEFHGSMFPGLGLAIDEFFTELAERKFWSLVYLTTACDFYRAPPADNDGTTIPGKVSAIAQCVMISQMLSQLVHSVDNAWNPWELQEDDRAGPFRVHCLP